MSPAYSSLSSEELGEKGGHDDERKILAARNSKSVAGSFVGIRCDRVLEH